MCLEKYTFMDKICIYMYKIKIMSSVNVKYYDEYFYVPLFLFCAPLHNSLIQIYFRCLEGLNGRKTRQ